MPPVYRALLSSWLLALGLLAVVCPGSSALSVDDKEGREESHRRHPTGHGSVLILGGGVAGVIAARTLHERGITNFKIVEARGELGGRLFSQTFGAPGREVTLEMGANWIQGTQTDNGPANPIWTLAPDGQTLKADYAICTFSLGVLQHDDVVFDPPLPDWKQEAIQSMVMATYTKIFLQFPEKFWFDSEMALYADSERGRYPVWQSLDHENFFPGSGIVFVTVTGDYSLRIEALSDEQVQDEVMGVLRSMLPNVTVPDPVAFHFPRWASDPLYRGSYSNWPSSFFSQHHENLRATVDHRLWFAGEATSQKYFGYLHGAYYEGQDVGNKVAKCIKGPGCHELKHVAEVTNAQPYII